MRLPEVWLEKRVLVTGATGIVGSALTRRLVESGAHVVALVRDADPQSELFRSGTISRVAVVNGPLEDFGTVERAVNEHDVDTVFHLGGQTIVGTAHRSPLQTLEANVRGTWNVLEAARVHSLLVRRMVVASSDKAYGAHAELPYREEMTLKGEAPYEVSKSCTDLVTRSYARTYGVPAAIARCANVYGPGDLNWSRLVPGTLRSLIRGEQPVIRSDGTYVRDYLYVEDVVDAFLLLAQAAENPEVVGEAFNFSTEAPLTVMEMYRAVCEAAGQAETEPKVLDHAVGEIRDQYLSAAKATQTLGWQPRYSLGDALTQTYQWYRQLLHDGAGPVVQ